MTGQRLVAALVLAALGCMTACGAAAPAPSSTTSPAITPTPTPPATATTTASAIDPSAAETVALKMFVALPPASGGGESTCSRQDPASCPVTPRLRMRIAALNVEPPTCHEMYADAVMPWGMAFTSAMSVLATGVTETGSQATVHIALTGEGGAPVTIDFVVVSTASGLLVDDIVYIQYPGGGPPLSVYAAHWNCH